MYHIISHINILDCKYFWKAMWLTN